MRALLLHANKFATTIIEESTRPSGIKPEQRKRPSEEMEDCLVCFFTAEQEDNEEIAIQFYEEIVKTASEIGTKNILISPFVHLSNNTAAPDIAKHIYEFILAKFKDMDFRVQSSHFGYHKSLQLDIKGHPGSFRYREF